jgi:hypothetical protein
MKIIDNPHRAASWKEYGFAPEEVEEWIKRGFDPNHAQWWADYEYTPVEAASWVKAGVVSPLDAFQFEEEGLTPKDVAPWIKVGITRVEDILKYIKAGKSPKKVKRELLRSDKKKLADEKELKYRKWMQTRIKY